MTNTKKEHNIMIVDDSPFIHRALTKALEAAGYKVCGAFNNGLEAVENYGQLKPDVLIMDITMPIMDGITAAQQITQSYPGAKIMLLSAMGDDEIIQESKVAGVGGFLTKPFKGNELVESLRSFIEL